MFEAEQVDEKGFAYSISGLIPDLSSALMNETKMCLNGTQEVLGVAGGETVMIHDSVHEG